MEDVEKTSAFPSTLWTDILSLQEPGDGATRERMERLIGRYWKPVYHAIRAWWSHNEEEARDLTQDFFLLILEGDVIARADPERGSFRHYLKCILRRFLVNDAVMRGRLKRGGGGRPLSLDFDAAGPAPCPPSAHADPIAEFDRAWGLQLLSESIDELERRRVSDGRSADAAIFRAYDTPEGERPSYRELASTFGMPDHEVRRSLVASRQLLRSILLEKVRDYVRDESELFNELDELFSL